MKRSDTSSPIMAPLRRIPLYVWLSAAAMFTVQMLVYYGTRLVLPYLTAHVLTGPLDDAIPFIPWWVVIYFLAFFTWAINSFWILSESKSHGYRFAAAYIVALLISAAIFLLYPGTMSRPAISTTDRDLLTLWMGFVYRIDSPTNLCPSLHVLLSYFCWRGTLGCRSIPKWYQWLSLVFLLLVCCSILFVKQHAIIDIPVAFLIGEASWQIAQLGGLERIPFALEHIYTKHRRNHS